MKKTMILMVATMIFSAPAFAKKDATFNCADLSKAMEAKKEALRNQAAEQPAVEDKAAKKGSAVDAH